MEVDATLKQHTEKLTKLEKELGGTIKATVGRGADYMEVSWEVTPGVIFYERVVVNPAIAGDELDITSLKATFEYNRPKV